MILLFITEMVFAGIFAALGSMVGHAFGAVGLVVGGVLGGLLGVTVATRVAIAAHWIERRDFLPTTFGGEIGFLLAAFIATHTLGSPVGPMLSTLLVGIGALSGLRVG